MAAIPQQSALSGLARAARPGRPDQGIDAEMLLSQATASKTSFTGQCQKSDCARNRPFCLRHVWLPLAAVQAYDDTHIQKSAIDRKLIASHRVVPLHKRGNRLAVAIADPTNLRALDEIRFQTGMAVDPVIVGEDQLSPLVAKLS